MPYELLKRVLTDVSAVGVLFCSETNALLQLTQRDQLSIAKTCVTLWQLAYPMAYDRLTVKIGPTTKASAWNHLASGVGLRYVHHLEIKSLYSKDNQSKRVEDRVAGTLIAALRRNRLLSFR